MTRSDLQVERLSDALSGKTLDVVVSGSIGAVEAVRFVRSLRRLGAEVVPWLTEGGARFVTPMALSWAAGRDVRLEWSGTRSHLAEADACVVAPASASFLARLAHGLIDTPASALATSYLGSGLPVIVCPNMHVSLAEAPAVRANLERLAGLSPAPDVLASREEEGKHKFPDPAVLADRVAHLLNRPRVSAAPVLVTLGGTRGYIDDVRYVGNYSTGALGSAIAEELYRLGHATEVVCGSARIHPVVSSRLVEAKTHAEMSQAVATSLARGAAAAVMAAAVLDYEPVERISGKVPSGRDSLTVHLKPTAKIIAGVNPVTGTKVAFKLEASLDEGRARRLAGEYVDRYALSMFVVNALGDVSETEHKAFVFERRDGGLLEATVIEGKRPLAAAVARHVHQRLRVS